MKEGLLEPCTRMARHFVGNRATEVLALQASPAFGVVLGGYRVEDEGLSAAALLMLGSCALTAYVFVFNDWAGYHSDPRDPRRGPHTAQSLGIPRSHLAIAAATLLALALVAFAGLGALTWLLGAAIAVLGLLYSSSPILGKGTPVASSVNHLAGGGLHFLLGYTLVHPLDLGAVGLGLFFALVFAAGHLNQEVRDFEGDRANGIRTNAVAFGRRAAFLASVFLFMAAYAVLAGLAVFEVMPGLLVWSPLAAVVHLVWSAAAIRRGLSHDTAIWMQRRYRGLYALIGLAILMG